MDKKVLFRVISEGKEYVIYTNGTVKGWKDAFVFNSFPALLAEDRERSRLRQAGPAQGQPLREPHKELPEVPQSVI
jgi:hypothetical protein